MGSVLPVNITISELEANSLVENVRLLTWDCMSYITINIQPEKSLLVRDLESGVTRL